MCNDCHGRSGRGDNSWAETFKPRPRNLSTGIFKFRTTPLGKLPLEADLRRTSCHGPTRKGDGPAAAGLSDIWKNPIISADLSEVHHKSGDQPADLYRTIATGLDGTPMPSFSAALKPDEIWNLVAYIKSIEKPK